MDDRDGSTILRTSLVAALIIAGLRRCPGAEGAVGVALGQAAVVHARLTV